MNPRRSLRKVSLRLTLFVLMPLCAVGFLIGSRVTHANRQQSIIQSLKDQGIVIPTGKAWPEVDWWGAFWGDNPLLSIQRAHTLGTPDQFQAIEPLTNLTTLTLDQPPSDLTAAQVRECKAGGDWPACTICVRCPVHPLRQRGMMD